LQKHYDIAAAKPRGVRSRFLRTVSTQTGVNIFGAYRDAA
jgi:hypothetical protein